MHGLDASLGLYGALALLVSQLLAIEIRRRVLRPLALLSICMFAGFCVFLVLAAIK
jgi:hypothetical protein